MSRTVKILVTIAGLLILATAVFLYAKRNSPSSLADGVTIRLIGEAYAPLEALDELKTGFTKETGIAVEIIRKSHTEVVSELSQELAARDTVYDLVLMPHRLLGRFVEKDQVIPIDEIAANTDLSAAVPETDLFGRWAKEISWYDDRQYGYPFTCLTMMLVWRTDLFDNPAEQAAFRREHGRDLVPPRTPDEFREVAEFFHRPSEGLYGTYLNGQQHVALWYEWLNWLYAFGADILDESSDPGTVAVTVNSEAAKRATRFYVDLLEVSAPESRNYNWDDALAIMQQGKAAIGLMWSDSVPYLEDPKDSKVAGKIGYGLVPSLDGRGTAQLEGWTYLIPRESPHPHEALQFILWAMRRDIQVAQVLRGGASPRRSVYEGPDVLAIPYISTFLDAVPLAVPKTKRPEAGEMTELAVAALSAMVANPETVDSELDELARKYRELLR